MLLYKQNLSHLSWIQFLLVQKTAKKHLYYVLERVQQFPSGTGQFYEEKCQFWTLKRAPQQKHRAPWQKAFITVWSSWFHSIVTKLRLVPCAMNVSIHYHYCKQGAWPRWWQRDKVLLLWGAEGYFKACINKYIQWIYWSIPYRVNWRHIYRLVEDLLHWYEPMIWSYLTISYELGHVYVPRKISVISGK